MILRSDRANSPSAILRSHPSEAGFTLIEVIVTLSILGLALTLIAGHRPPWSGTLGLRAAAAELAAGLRLARSEAILRNRPVHFEVDLTSRQYRVGAAAPRALPPRLTIELLTITGEQRSDAMGDIRFNPDGTSTGGRISLDDGIRRIAIGVDWLSSRVSVADVH
jgi:general secretion pathway protein H